MRVLSQRDLDSWHSQGYVIVHDAAPRENLQAVIDAIWTFQEMDPHDPDTWYRRPERRNGMEELNGSGMVEMYNHPALWANRQLPRNCVTSAARKLAACGAGWSRCMSAIIRTP